MKMNSTMFIRAENKEKYSKLSNGLLQDRRVSWKARGIMAYILSLPSDWTLHVKELEKHSDKDGRDALNSGIRELEQFGYIERVNVRNERGHILGTHYLVNETPPGDYRKPSKRRNIVINTNEPTENEPQTEKPFSASPYLQITDSDKEHIKDIKGTGSRHDRLYNKRFPPMFRANHD